MFSRLPPPEQPGDMCGKPQWGATGRSALKTSEPGETKIAKVKGKPKMTPLAGLKPTVMSSVKRNGISGWAKKSEHHDAAPSTTK